VNQARVKQKMPAPKPNLLYTAAQDVLPAAKQLLATPTVDTEEQFFASLAFTFSPNTLGFWFHTQKAYEAFRVWFDQQVVQLAPALPQNTALMLRKFQKLDLVGLTESLILRKDDTDELQDFSFPRVLVWLLMQYVHIQQNTQTNPDVGILPFVLTELFLPKNIVFVNVETHARASARKIIDEWDIINQALADPVKVFSTNKINKLTSFQRITHQLQQRIPGKSDSSYRKSAKIKFRQFAPKTVDILPELLRVIRKMKEVNRSHNVFHKIKTTFIKANRRDPQDFNKPGKSVSTHYLPDLHVYVDTSGSITEKNYQDAIMMLLSLAKKLNINLYFSSFSNILSEEVLLHTTNKSVSAAWVEFQRIPKVFGGTDYKQIWEYINRSPARKQRLSLIITDFEWYAPNVRVEHPKNLFYAPCSHMDWWVL